MAELPGAVTISSLIAIIPPNMTACSASMGMSPAMLSNQAGHA
jgi:Cu/Ag efflux pump CusA